MMITSDSSSVKLLPLIPHAAVTSLRLIQATVPAARRTGARAGRERRSPESKRSGFRWRQRRSLRVTDSELTAPAGCPYYY